MTGYTWVFNTSKGVTSCWLRGGSWGACPPSFDSICYINVIFMTFKLKPWWYINIKPNYHFLFLLSPRLTITFPPTEDGLVNESTPFEEVIAFTYFSFVDSDLNKLRFVPPNSSFLKGFSPLTESKEVALKEFFVGRLILRLELGLALMSGRKL